jgi:hypothetical protein
MKIYHYTKCNRLNSIFCDGFIATEMNRASSNVIKNTDYVWLTEKNSYPKTALPLLTNFAETSLALHLQHKGIYVDLDKIGSEIGRFYRFSFESTDSRIKKWFFSEERKTLKNNLNWILMESIANKVGDDVRSFWFAKQNLTLENFNLEVFDRGWNMLLEDVSLSSLCNQSLNTINELKTLSIQKCKQFGIPPSHLFVA